MRSTMDVRQQHVAIPVIGMVTAVLVALLSLPGLAWADDAPQLGPGRGLAKDGTPGPVCWQLVDEEEGEVTLHAHIHRLAQTSFLISGVFIFANGAGEYANHGNLAMADGEARMNLTTTNFGELDGQPFTSSLLFGFRLAPDTLSGNYEAIGPFAFQGQVLTLIQKGTATYQGTCP